jgi:hypothetical protein
VRDAFQAFVCPSHLRMLLFACPLEWMALGVVGG